MPLFGKRHEREGQASPLQPPDEFAAKGKAAYGGADFATAAEAYGNAVDKLHTMYVFPAPHDRHRQPSGQDQPILQGLISSLGAAEESGTRQRGVAQQSAGYLRDIGNTLQDQGNSAAAIYVEAAIEVDRFSR